MGLVLSLAIWRAKRRIRRIASVYCADARVFWLGAVDINPGLLAFWIATSTDEQRDRLVADRKAIQDMRRALVDVGYPSGAIEAVGFQVESQETVDRVWSGNWHHAMR